eukprot:TRINITY_DN1421_c0_g3_i1.p1 TRINITY_DN1421_c0_g3~~TRINITY_DN1421_c0_g3_i1.p1  ORF type:complete len:891 (+),score=316.40 TRINITY_DN1421_c0_g3_i1:129-2801(+)
MAMVKKCCRRCDPLVKPIAAVTKKCWRWCDPLGKPAIWRSQPMQLVQLFIQRDAAHDTLDELGEAGLVHFRDLNANVNMFQRNFVNEVKRCENMERKIRFLYTQVKKENDLLSKLSKPTTLNRLIIDRAPTQEKQLDIDELEVQLDNLEKELRQMNSNQELLTKNFNELTEMSHVLKHDASFFEEDHIDETGNELLEGDQPQPEAPAADSIGKLNFATGVILKDQYISFERVMWRSLRGNVIMREEDIDEPLTDPATGDSVQKKVFIIFAQGEQAMTRLRKICESFGARIYQCPGAANQRAELLAQISARISDMETVIERSHDHRRQLLATLDRSLQPWVFLVRKEMATYHTMNMFNYDVGHKCLIAEGWVPESKTNDIRDALNRATARSGASVPSVMSVIPTKEEPPTYFPTNKFTECMQGIIDAYGTARYGEVNPAVFSIVTFPFLFAIMFGDTGHAVMMLLASIAFIAFEKKLAHVDNEILGMIFGGRYVLILMALFSIYTGLIYNDIFGVGVNLCGTAWKYNETKGELVRDRNRVYPFGVDVQWKGADNELYFYNSFKMKLSVIFGVIQMVLGLFMGLLNHIHYKQWLRVWFEFIPQAIFLIGLFGYLVILIFYKWWTPLDNEPYLINVVIDIFLKFNSLPAEEKMYAAQNTVQVIIAFVCVIAVFVMLLTNPLIMLVSHKCHQRRSNRHAGHLKLQEEEDAFDVPLSSEGAGDVELATDTPAQDAEQGTTPEGSAVISGPAEAEMPAASPPAPSAPEEEEFVFSEIFIHQAIHTIEFVLGCISNTASYLRLWALSLAHAELSLVFYEQVLLMTVKQGAFYYVVVGFSVWGGATLAVLLIMEALSAFLHALRLHWVEFQNKFYNGDGYAFEPYTFTAMNKDLKEDN